MSNQIQAAALGAELAQSPLSTTFSVIHTGDKPTNLALACLNAVEALNVSWDQAALVFKYLTERAQLEKDRRGAIPQGLAMGKIYEQTEYGKARLAELMAQAKQRIPQGSSGLLP